MATESYERGLDRPPLLDMPIGDCLDATATAYPDTAALISRHQRLRYSYAELREEVDLVARALLAFGIERGERVGIWAPNCAQWCITQLATAKIGAILVNINPAYRVSELEYALTQSGVATLVTDGAFRTSHYVDMLCELAPALRDRPASELKSERLPQLERIVCLDETRATTGMWTWAALREQAAGIGAHVLAERQAALDPYDVINIQYTSGTTGRPKGAALTHHNILNNGFFVAEEMGITAGDRVVIPVPLYHCFGMVMGNLGCITHGAAMVYPNDGFDARLTLESVQAEQANALYGVPTMFIAELEHPEFASFDLSSLRTGIMAGTYCPMEIMKQVIERMHMGGVTVCYGMTETSPVSVQTGLQTLLDKRVATAGRVHPHLEIKLVDPVDGQTVPRSEPGELCTRGYSVMRGYWNNEEATAAAIDGDGWMHSGDLATMDDDGYIAVTGRIKDMIVRGGENIYPREIEEFLVTHPAISDAQVFGIEDATYGEEVVAWVKLVANAQVDEEALRVFCCERIAHFKIPRHIRFVEEFPMTVTGKIQKFRMRGIEAGELGLTDLS
ncbi:MAG: AMP-binding protein [Salinisphaera sp.]|nr:AMP-binding protein [Salinisphaera sp.]